VTICQIVPPTTDTCRSTWATRWAYRPGSGGGGDWHLCQCFLVERVTRIELAPSAWKLDGAAMLDTRNPRDTAETWHMDYPVHTHRMGSQMGIRKG